MLSIGQLSIKGTAGKYDICEQQIYYSERKTSRQGLAHQSVDERRPISLLDTKTIFFGILRFCQVSFFNCLPICPTYDMNNDLFPCQRAVGTFYR